MKNMKKPIPLLPAVLALAAAAFVLRRLLYASAVDAKNLLIANHPLSIALWTVVLAGAALIVAGVWKSDGTAACEDNFRPSNPAALGQFLMGYTVLMMVLLNDFPLEGAVGAIWKVLGFLSAPGLVWGGICRMRGKKPFFGIHAVLCLFLLLHLVSRYQTWSGNPQLQDYVFDLLASVMLMLFSYYCAALEADMGNRRMRLATGLLTVLLCGGALAVGPDYAGLSVSGAFWAAAELYRPELPPRKEEVSPHDPS